MLCVWSVLAPLGQHRAEASTATGSLVIAASVNTRCAIAVGPLVFGNYWPTSGIAHDAQGQLTVNCTQSLINFIMHVRIGQGSQPAAGSTTAAPLRRMAHGSTGDRLSYFLYRNAARTQVWGDTIGTAAFPGFGAYPRTLPIYGRIPAGQMVSSGAYSDTAVVTLWF